MHWSQFNERLGDLVESALGNGITATDLVVIFKDWVSDMEEQAKSDWEEGGGIAF